MGSRCSVVPRRSRAFGALVIAVLALVAGFDRSGVRDLAGEPSAGGHFAAGDVPRRSGAALQWSVRDLLGAARLRTAQRLPVDRHAVLHRCRARQLPELEPVRGRYAVLRRDQRREEVHLLLRGVPGVESRHPRLSGEGVPELRARLQGRHEEQGLPDRRADPKRGQVGHRRPQSPDRAGQRVLRVHAARRRELQGRAPVAVTRLLRPDPARRVLRVPLPPHRRRPRRALRTCSRTKTRPACAGRGSRPTATPATRW